MGETVWAAGYGRGTQSRRAPVRLRLRWVNKDIETLKKYYDDLDRSVPDEAEMALAGIRSFVPCDEVIETMYQIGLSMSPALRETAQGGLAATPTGRKWKSLLWENQDTEA